MKFTGKNIRSSFAKISSKLDFKHRFALAAVFIAVLFAAVLFLTSGNKANTTSAEYEAYQDNLLSQVETMTGDPRTGRDPASQQQVSLMAAASSPTGAGQRVDNPAAGVQGGQSNQYTKSDIYGDPNQTGLNSSGCFYDYGEPGQCVPAHAATNGDLTCEGVRTHGGFPNGVKVSGIDRFGLDKNNDKLACGPGE